MIIQTFNLSSEGNIPKSQGIYAFFLNNISPGKVGLRGEGPYTDEQLEAARCSLISRVSSSMELFCTSNLSGSLVESDKAPHLRMDYKVVANSNINLDTIERLKNIELTNIKDYIEACSFMPFFMPPIYVGITVEQTLYDRYFQHKSDYESSADRFKFGVRLRDKIVRWSDIMFICVEFDKGVGNKEILRTLEKHIHTISKPLFSLR